METKIGFQNRYETDYKEMTRYMDNNKMSAAEVLVDIKD